MSSIFPNIYDSYWKGQPSGSSSEIVFGSARGSIVVSPSSDVAYQAWLAKGFTPFPWPYDSTSAVTPQALDAILENYGLPPTGLVPLSVSSLVAYAFSKVSNLLSIARNYSLAPGVSVKCDATTPTEANLVGLNAWGTASPTSTQPWVDNFGTATPITGAEAVVLAQSVVVYGQSVYAVLAVVSQEITTGSITTISQIDAAAWPI